MFGLENWQTISTIFTKMISLSVRVDLCVVFSLCFIFSRCKHYLCCCDSPHIDKFNFVTYTNFYMHTRNRKTWKTHTITFSNALKWIHYFRCTFRLVQTFPFKYITHKSVLFVVSFFFYLYFPVSSCLCVVYLFTFTWLQICFSFSLRRLCSFQR